MAVNKAGTHSVHHAPRARHGIVTHHSRSKRDVCLTLSRNEMAHIWPVCFLCIPFLLFAAGDHSWQGKRISDWTEDDAHQVLTDSPWALTVTPRFNRSPDNNSGRGTGGRLQ